MAYKIVIADDEPITRLNMYEILVGAGYEVVGEAGDGFDALDLCRAHHPDLALLDIKMPLIDGLKVSQLIKDEKIAGSILLLTAHSGKEFVAQAKAVGVEGYLVKPVSEDSLLPMVEVAIAKGIEMGRMREDIIRVQDELESRKLIERAKGILMAQDKLSEDDAYKKIRKISMDKGRPMKEIANAILLNSG
jgi:AmiR/NasT family two-component response regulator